MRRDGNRAHPGPAAAMRDAERLVQVQVTDVGADRGRAGEPDLCVQVRAIHVDLAAVLVHDTTDLLDRRLEDPVRRGIRHHQRAQRVLVLFRLRLEVGDVDVALRVGLHHHHVHSRHDRACRIGAMRRLRDQARRAMALTAVLVIGANDEQPRKLSLRAGIRLQRHFREPGDFGEPLLELAEERRIPLRLRARRKGMQAVEARPGDRQHLARGVELHRAGAERNHRRRQRQVAVLEPLQVPQHLRFGVMGVEDRMGAERRGARQRWGNGIVLQGHDMS